MKSFDPRISRADVASLDEDGYLWALMEPAWDDYGAGTPGQQALASVTYFVRDVENGGLSQALWNRDPIQVQHVITGFDRLGATEQAEIVRSAVRLVFGDQAPHTLETRRSILDKLSREWEESNLYPLDQQLYDETRLYPYFRRYIEAHPDEFFRD